MSDVGSLRLSVTNNEEYGGKTDLLGNDLRAAVKRALVLDSLTRGHHHATTDSVQRVRGDTGGDGHGPAERERRHEVVLQVAGPVMMEIIIASVELFEGEHVVWGLQDNRLE